MAESIFSYKVHNIRTRVTVAQANAGLTLIPAVVGKKIRMTSGRIISVGGAAGAVTTVDILGTQAGLSVKLVAFAQASLTQSTLLADGGSGATILADGASHAPCDGNTAITIGKTGATITTATNFDVFLSYTLED